MSTINNHYSSRLPRFLAHFLKRFSSASMRAPVAIGGLGGSGTRLVASMVQYLGFYLGGNLNESVDNLWYTLLLKRPALLNDPQLLRDHIGIFVTVMAGEPLTTKQQQQLRLLAGKPVAEFSADWATMMVDDILATNQKNSPEHRSWGWKEPNTHAFLPELFKQIPSLRYIHVMRNGLDMAFSENKNQIPLWGEFFLKEPVERSTETALRYWVAVQQRSIKLAQDYPGQFLLLNYDNLCVNPPIELDKLLSFLSLTVTAEQRKHLLSLPTIPEGINRYQAHDLSCFAAEDIRYVKSLGFNVDPEGNGGGEGHV